MAVPHDVLLDLTLPSPVDNSVATLGQARQWCSSFALGHYENFPVGSILLPARVRPHFYALYAFARLADDIADEPGFGDVELRRAALDALEDQLERIPTRNPIFVALHATIDATGLPVALLRRLLIAFRRDAGNVPIETWEELVQYCRYSANPVGEAILHLFGVSSGWRVERSDDICTALQLVNFWQDLSVDLRRNRLNVPRELLERYGLSASSLSRAELRGDHFPASFSALLAELIQRTETIFRDGMPLVREVPSPRLRAELAAIAYGGKTVLNDVAALGCNILTQRPTITGRRSIGALPSVVAAALFRSSHEVRP